jgi:hypothetical protein
MTVLDKIMNNYTHTVYYLNGDTEMQYRCKAENAMEALEKCQQSIGIKLQTCAVGEKESD